MITADQLRKIAGTRSTSKTIDDIAEAFNKHAASYGVTTQKRIAQTLANISHETGGFTKLAESLNYSIEGLLKTFGRHRISEADARKYGRTKTRPANQVMIANIIYGGAWGHKNLGNTLPDDGWRYRGSGPGQTTGRRNFAEIERETGMPVLANPDLLREAENGTKAAFILWQKWGLNELSDQEQTTAIRKRWNGGKLGLAEVKAAYDRAMRLLLEVPASPSPSPPKVTPSEPFHAPPDYVSPKPKPAPAGFWSRLRALFGL